MIKIHRIAISILEELVFAVYSIDEYIIIEETIGKIYWVVWKVIPFFHTSVASAAYRLSSQLHSTGVIIRESTFYTVYP